MINDSCQLFCNLARSYCLHPTLCPQPSPTLPHPSLGPAEGGCPGLGLSTGLREAARDAMGHGRRRAWSRPHSVGEGAWGWGDIYISLSICHHHKFIGSQCNRRESLAPGDIGNGAPRTECSKPVQSTDWSKVPLSTIKADKTRSAGV